MARYVHRLLAPGYAPHGRAGGFDGRDDLSRLQASLSRSERLVIEERSQDTPRTDDDDGDAEAMKLVSKSLRPGDEPMFRGPVGPVRGYRDTAGDRRHVHDDSAASADHLGD